MAENDKIYSFKEISILFPKSAVLLRTYITELLKEKKVPVEAVEEMTDNILEYSMDSSNRLLYDFFDKYRLYIVVDCMDFHKGEDWAPSVRDKFLISKKSRVQAETIAFNESFVMLENQTV